MLKIKIITIAWWPGWHTGVVLVTSLLAGFLCDAQDLARYEFNRSKMGTAFRMVVYSDDSTKAFLATEKAFARIDSLNAIMSDYERSSELNKLVLESNADSKRFYPVSKDLWMVLKYAQMVSRRSGGAFDVTVGPLTKLWRRAFRQRTFPEEEAIQRAKKLVNYRWLKFQSKDRSVRLKKPGMRLDLGGIAKGYAVDEAYKILSAYGLDKVLVDGGGDIYVGNPPPGNSGWRISRKVLRGDSLTIETEMLSNVAVATSGDTYRFLEWKGKRYSHIIDPKTGFGITNRRLVSVKAGNCMVADVMASTLSVTKLRKLKRVTRRFEVVADVVFEEQKGRWQPILRGL